MAGEIQQWMQDNAPWEDQTGAAREGLRATVGRENTGGDIARELAGGSSGDNFEFGIVVYHTVDYGIWLEIRWNGKYAIIQPTIEHWGHAVMGALEIFQ